MRRPDPEKIVKDVPVAVLHHICPGPDCGVEYIPKRRDQVFCDPTCGKAWHRVHGPATPTLVRRRRLNTGQETTED